MWLKVLMKPSRGRENMIKPSHFLVVYLLLPVLTAEADSCFLGKGYCKAKQTISNEELVMMRSDAQKEMGKININNWHQNVIQDELQRISFLSAELDQGVDGFLEKMGVASKSGVRFCFWAASEAKNKEFYDFDNTQIIKNRNSGVICDCYHLSPDVIQQSKKAVQSFSSFIALMVSPISVEEAGLSSAEHKRAQAFENILLDFDQQAYGQQCENMYQKYLETLATCKKQLLCPTYQDRFEGLNG